MLLAHRLSYSLALSIALSAFATSTKINQQYNDDIPPPFRVHPIHSIPIINGTTACKQLQTSIPLIMANHSKEPLNITNVISQVYAEGANPTTKELFNSIPAAILQPKENIAGAIASVGEWNKSEVIGDYGYGEEDDVQSVLGGLPSFCRFGASITTSNMSSVWFETWMPLPGNSSSNNTEITNTTSDNTTSLWKQHHRHSNQTGRAPRANWRGRLVFVGNNGQSGGVFYPEMKQILTRYRESTASTNGGHFGSASLSNWTIGNPESQLDFGRRGVHLSSLASQVVVKTFYGIRDRRTKHGHKRVGFNTYFKGCSTGGRQGMGEAQNYPEDYDGIIAGCPAVYYNDLNAYQIHVNSLQNDTTSPSFIPLTLYPVIHKHIIDECDLNDGVRDAVIQNPATCHPKLHKLLCPATNTTTPLTTNSTSNTMTDATSAIIAASINSTASTNSTICLTQAQLDNLYNIYKPLRYPDGTIIHEPVLYGSEFSWTVTDGVVGTPFPPASGWFQYQVLNLNTSVSSFNPNTAVEGNFSLIELGNRLNPGKTNTANADLSRYFARGSKLIHYHGTADQLIPSGSSDRYFKRVHKETSVREGKLSDYYRYFHIPGMAHCRGGDGPWNFGGAGQTAAPGSRPLEYNAKHDALLALFKWTEYDIAPNYIVGAAYKSNFTETPYTIGSTNDLTPFANGIKFSHKLCPYPKQAVLIDSDNPYNASSLHCEYL